MEEKCKSGAFPWIVFEGIDGSGKSTQAKLLAVHIDAVYSHVFDTPEGDVIRQVFLESSISTLYEALLLLAAREAYRKRFLDPSAPRRPLITDRYLMSISSMQGRDDERIRSLIDNASAGFTHSAVPDLTIILDVPATVALGRRKAPRDRIEALPSDFHESVRQEFLRCADLQSGVVVVDGTGSIASVRDRVVGAVAEIWPNLALSRAVAAAI